VSLTIKTAGSAGGANLSNAGKAAPKAAAKSTYDINRATADYSALRAGLLTWFNDTLGPINDFYELTEPTTPFVSITDEKGKNTVYQCVDPTIRNYTDAVCAFVRAEKIRVRCPSERNPGAEQQDLSDTENMLRLVWQIQDEIQVGDFIEERKKLLCLRGMYFAQVTLLDPDDADESYMGFPLRLDLVDPYDVAWETGQDGALSLVIVQKRRIARELPQKWLAAAGITDLNTECEVLEAFDCMAHGAIVNNKVVKPMAPHGYVDLIGRPAVPFAVCMMSPGPQRQGGVGPLASGVSQRGKRVGYPLVAALLKDAKKRSRILTMLFHAAKMQSMPFLEVKGLNLRDGGPGVDFKTGVGLFDKDPGAGMRWVPPPDASPALKLMLDAINQDLQSSSANVSILQGQIQTNVSGVAANHMTSWARSKAESLAITLEHGLVREGQLIIGNLRNHLQPSTARQIQKATGAAPLLSQGEHSPLTQDGYALPFYERATGDKLRPIDSYTLEKISEIEVSIESDTRTPMESEMAMAKEYATVADANGDPLVDLNWIRSNLMHIDNTAEVDRQVTLRRMLSQGNNPYATVKQLEALLDEWETVVEDPEQLQSYRAQVDQAKQQAISTAFNQAFQSFQQAMSTPAQAQTPIGAPGGQPPLGPPMGQQGMPPQPMGGPPQGPPMMPPGGPPPGTAPLPPAPMPPVQGPLPPAGPAGPPMMM
jgi:hypothetical protein